LISIVVAADTTAGSAAPSTTNTPAPEITTITPDSGPAGTSVILVGTEFDEKANLILFGDSNGAHHLDGSADNSRANVGSTDGKTLSFVIPGSGPGGILGDASNHCGGIAAIQLASGPYKIAVTNANGTSNSVTLNLGK